MNMDFYTTMIICNIYARKARLDLIRLLSDSDVEVLDLQNFNFRVKVDTSRVKYVSCSIPPDINRGIVEEPIFETAIADENGLIYDETLGYKNVRNFTTIYQVADEIRRICSV